MFYDLARSARDLLSADSSKDSGPGSLLARITDLLYYGDFEIFEQVASISETDHTNVVGYKAGQEGTGGLLLSAPIGPIGCKPGDRREDEVAAIRDGRVWGAGAMSGRLALLCQITAAASFKRGDLRRPVMVAGTFGQEHRGSGTRYLLESGHVEPEWVLVGAGTNLELVRAHRGYMVFVVEITPQEDQWRTGFPSRGGYHVVVPGVSAGSVLAGAGRSAFERACGILDSLAEQGPLSVHGLHAGTAVNRVPDRCEFDLLVGHDQLPPLPPDVTVTTLPDDATVSPAVTACLGAWKDLWVRIRDARRHGTPPPEHEFEPGGALMNVGIIRTTGGGLAIRFDDRPLPGEDPYALFQEVARLAEEATAAAGGALLVDVRVTINRPPLVLPDEGALVEAVRQAARAHGLLPVTSTLPHYTDGAMYAACDLDAVVIGPGWWGDAAEFGRESVPLRQMELAVAIYRDVIQRLCG